MSKSIRPEELAVEIISQLNQYCEEVTEEIKDEVRSVSDECRGNIKLNAPQKSGKYKRGWKLKVVYENKNDIRIRIYNATKPQLAHILEFGYAKRNGGRVDGKPHIYPAENLASSKLLEKAKVAVKG